MSGEYPYKTKDLAAELDISPKTLSRKAAALRLGIDLGGRAGYRFSADDRRRLLESMKFEQPVARKRRAS